MIDIFYSCGFRQLDFVDHDNNQEYQHLYYIVKRAIFIHGIMTVSYYFYYVIINVITNYE